MLLLARKRAAKGFEFAKHWRVDLQDSRHGWRLCCLWTTPITSIARTVFELAFDRSDVVGAVMDEGFSQERVRLIRDLAEKADSFTKRRLLDLVKRYDDPKRKPLRRVSHPLANLPSESNWR
jgi:hypothetical protein